MSGPVLAVGASEPATVVVLRAAEAVVVVAEAAEPAVVVVREPVSALVLTALGAPGPVGPAGPPGAAGEGQGGFYLHTQAVPATVWTIVHQLGYDPGGVTVTDTDGYTLDGFSVQYLVAGQSLRLSFDISVAGVATIS